jgi:hypothetical protein
MNSVPRSSSKRLIASPVMERSCLIALVPLFPPEKVMGLPMAGMAVRKANGAGGFKEPKRTPSATGRASPDRSRRHRRSRCRLRSIPLVLVAVSVTIRAGLTANFRFVSFEIPALVLSIALLILTASALAFGAERFALINNLTRRTERPRRF